MRRDRRHHHGRIGRPAEPLLSRPVAVLVQRHDLCAARSAIRRLRRQRRTRCGWSPEASGEVLVSVSGDRVERRHDARSDDGRCCLPWCALPCCRWRGVARPAARTSIFICRTGRRSSRTGTTASIYPHWAESANYLAGEPRFVFYPPLSWIVGGLLGVVLPWTWTPVAFTLIALLGAGFSFRAMARDGCPKTARRSPHASTC